VELKLPAIVPVEHGIAALNVLSHPCHQPLEQIRIRYIRVIRGSHLRPA
jgi:hypothetical protein